MPKLPSSLVQRITTMHRTMNRNAAGGRSSLVAPEPRPLQKPETYQPVGTPHRYATVVVAAANSSDESKEGADLVGTGTSSSRTDHEIAQEAFGRIAANPTQSGKVVFLEGQYYFGDQADAVDLTDGMLWLDGMGAEYSGPGTQIRCADNGGGSRVSPFKLYGQCQVSNLNFWQASIALDVNGFSFDMHHNYFDNCRQVMVCPDVVAYDSFIWYMSRFCQNELDGCGESGKWVIDANFDSDGFSQWLIAENTSNGNPLGTLGDLRLVPGSGMYCDYLRVIGNAFLNSVHIERPRASVIANNIIGGLLELDGGDTIAVTGNTGYQDYSIANITELALNGNVINADLTLTTLDDVAATGNVVTGTFTETAVTNKRYAGNRGFADA